MSPQRWLRLFAKPDLDTENFGNIDGFAQCEARVRMSYSRDGEQKIADAALVVRAIGWEADTLGLDLTAAGVETNARGFVGVDKFLQTSALHVFAAGDVTGKLMLVPQALQDGFVAGTNAVLGPLIPVIDQPAPIGSFTNPEYAQVGITESQARREYDVIVAIIHFDSTTRTIIDGRTGGFCKPSRTAVRKILGCHVVGDRAVEITQVAAVAMAAGMPVDDLDQFRSHFRPIQECLDVRRHKLHASLIWALERRKKGGKTPSLFMNLFDAKQNAHCGQSYEMSSFHSVAEGRQYKRVSEFKVLRSVLIRSRLLSISSFSSK